MFSGNSCSKARVPCLDILLWTFCFQILLLLVYSCHLTYTYKKYSVTRMVHKIIKMNNKLSGEEEGRAIQCHGPTLSGKGWQGVGRDKGPDCNPHVTVQPPTLLSHPQRLELLHVWDPFGGVTGRQHLTFPPRFRPRSRHLALAAPLPPSGKN